VTGDPYEEAEYQQRQEAKLVPPQPARKNRKILIAGMVLTGTIVAVVIVAHIAGVALGGSTQQAHPVPKPTTLTKQQSDAFAMQQSGEAGYMKGLDRNKSSQSREDMVLGQANGLASDAYEEADGVPKKTQAQEDAEHGRNGGSHNAPKSEAEQQKEKAALEAAHRRQNDLDASPLSVDFSSYFEREKQPSAVSSAPAHTEAVSEPPAAHRRSAFSDALTEEGQEPEVEAAASKSKKEAHDPREDYTFDSSFGKLYRLMEDTLIETILVNRLTGASVGPVITMVATDVFSENGSHLLIPKGTRLLGRISAVGSVSQERLFVAFHRMIMPDGYSVSLDKFQGLDVVGQTGLRDLVNHHYFQIFGASLALAAVSATTQIGNSGGSFGSYDWGVQMRNGVSQGLGQSAQRVMERFMNVLPTFTIRERARVTVMLAGDLLLPDTRNHAMDPDL
jgi:type IV secretion system protein VirB10